MLAEILARQVWVADPYHAQSIGPSTLIHTHMRNHLTAAVLLPFVTSITVGQSPNLVVNGSFESYSGTGLTNIGYGLPPWQIGGPLDIVRPENGPDFFRGADGNVSLSLNWYAPGSISQVIATSPNVTYELRYWMAAEIFGGIPLRTMNVLWNGALVGSPSFTFVGQTTTTMGWVEFVHPVVGTGSDTLTFVSTTPNNYGPALDHVSVALPSTGVSTYGVQDGTIGCNGIMTMRANGTPSVGNSSFGLGCTNAPPLSLGACLLGVAPLVSQPLGFPLTFVVDLSPGTQIAISGIASNVAGFGSLPAPIPNLPSFAGTHFYCQCFWSWSTSCPAVQSTYGFSSSAGMQLIIQ